MNMETLPMPLDAMDGASARGLSEFRVDSPAEVNAFLRQIVAGNVLVQLISPEGGHYNTTLWTADAARRVLSFAAQANDPGLQRLLESQEAVAVCYLDLVKLQWDLHDLMLVHGAQESALQARLPHLLYRFQRRNSFRVKPLGSPAPAARLHHPAWPGLELSLRVLDISVGGVALFLPEDAAAIEPGTRIEGTRLELDVDTTLVVTLAVQHVTQLHSESRGVRLGCRFARLAGDAERLLQRFVDQTQKRQRLLSL
jgi:c-di-GMP-binding flagellar brake protein YcgR